MAGKTAETGPPFVLRAIDHVALIVDYSRDIRDPWDHQIELKTDQPR